MNPINSYIVKLHFISLHNEFKGGIYTIYVGLKI